MAPTRANGKICYLEIPAVDVHQSAGFYAAVFGWKLEGHLPVFSTRSYTLAQAGQAQRDLASRATSGKLLLQIS